MPPALNAALDPFGPSAAFVRRPTGRAPLAAVPADAPDPAPPAAPPTERARRLWSNSVTLGSAVVVVLCTIIEISPWLGAGPIAVALGLAAVAGAAAYAARHVTRLRDELARLRRELESARQAEHWHRAVLDEVAEAVLVASPEGRLLETNQAAWRLLGRGREELSGRRLWDLLPLDDRVVALRRGELAATHGGGLRRLLRPDGSAILADVSWSTLDDGRVIYLARPFR
jgi:PAS domain S-box-containing protein